MFKQIFVWANMLEIFAFDLQKNWTAGPIKLVCGAIGPFFKKHRKNCECCPVSQLIVR